MPGGFKGPLRIAIEDFLETFSLGKAWANWFGQASEEVEQSLIPSVESILDQIEDTPGLPDVIKKSAIRSLPKKFQGGALSLGAIAVQTGMSAASAFMAPVMRLINYAVDNQLKTARVDPAIAYTMLRRDPSLEGQLSRQIGDLGWDTVLSKAWGQITHPRPAEQDLITLFLRGELPDAELDPELTARGWLPEDIERLKSVRQLIPPVTDIIRLAVREAFNPEAIRQFGLDADFPAEVGDWAEKQGLSSDWAMKYWVAHWENPSLQMAFEMLHRLRPGTTDTPFTEDDLDLLFRIQDVSPYWRPRLKAISFAPYTRVDVRRMYGTGILSVEQVKAAYLDLGYDDEHAANLTAFTTTIEAAEEKGISRASIQQAYKRKVWTREQASSELASIGFSSDQVEFWLSLTDWEIEQDLLNDELEVVSFLYIEGEIDEAGVYGRLGRFNLPAEQMSLLIRQWDIKRLQKIKLPTEAQLEDFYRRDIIPFETLTDTLTRKGYSLERVDWITRRIDLEQTEQAAEEAEQAQKEAERVELSSRTKDYQKRVASLRSDVAYLRLAIANLKASRYNLTDPAAIAAIPGQVAELQAQIADLNLTISDERVSLLNPPAS